MGFKVEPKINAKNPRFQFATQESMLLATKKVAPTKPIAKRR
jgi:hypothetical protein